MKRLLSGMSSLAMAAALLVPSVAAAQDTGGRIIGTVTDLSGEPLSAVQIYIEGTSIGGLSQENGRFLLLNVPAGNYTVAAQRIGFATVRETNVVVTAGQDVTLEMRMSVTALSMNEIVVTGVVDPVEGIKLPFTVGKVSAEDIQVAPVANPITALAGKVAGVNIVQGSGQPGDGASILLRTPTSINEGTAPMYVVDGVILSTSTGAGSTVDLNGLDIESIEVVKGAAAASLYGSRAANGVIQIRTKRGSELAQGQTRFTVRSEYGQSALPRRIDQALAHQYLQAPDGTWIDETGAAVDRANRVLAPNNMVDQAYQTPLFDNLGAFFNPGGFASLAGTMSANSASTNFFVSAEQRTTEGALENNDGFEQTSFRVNVDHRLRDNLSLAANVFHSVSLQDELSGGPFRPIASYEPDINLGLRDANGNYLQLPDPTQLTENPIWRQGSRDNQNKRNRTLASGDIRFNPFSWLRLSGNFSYDRFQRDDKVYVPRGVITSVINETESTGVLAYENDDIEALNGSIDAQFIYNFESLTARATLRGIFERERSAGNDVEGRDFAVLDLEDIDAAASLFGGSNLSEIRSDGYLADLAIDFKDRYIGSFLIRRDGSSLFGPDARWNTFFRAGGAWLMGRESWFPFDFLSEFKLRYAYGTAGNRPAFSRQYETWTVNGQTGAVGKGTLGNTGLLPEVTHEQDLGFDAIINDRFQVRFSYIDTRTEDLILAVPLSAVTGYSTQYQNTGEQTGTTFEVELEAALITKPDMSWTTTVVADRSRTTITEWNRSCFFGGTVDQRNFCQDSGLDEMWGERFIQSASDLPEELQANADQFQVNDDGYLVWVGPGASWQDGLSADGTPNLWGTSSPDLTYGGSALRWGIPLVEVDETGQPLVQLLDRSFPDIQLGWVNSFRWKGLSVFSQLQANFGGAILNQSRQRGYQDVRHGDVSQIDKPLQNRKTIDYYQALYNFNNVSSHFIEDGGFVRLRELAVNYTLSPDLITKFKLDQFGASGITLGLTGRNLFTITDYSGYDPEVGSVLQRVDNFAYPNMRTITGQLSIVF